MVELWRFKWLFFTLGLVYTPPGYAQAPFPFLLRAQVGDSVANVANGSGITVGADAIGKPVAFSITAIYQGSASARILQPPELIGSADFSVTTRQETPLTLQPGQSLTLDLRYLPRTANRATASLNVPFEESASIPNSPPARGLITLGLTGAAPELQLSYFLQTDGNVLSLTNGSKITFNATPINTNSQATIIISNRGSTPGVVSSISVTGESFQALGVPLLPGTIAPNADLRFVIRYMPVSIGSDSGKLRVVLGDTPIEVDLEGSAVGSSFSYELLRGGDPVPFSASQLLSLGETPVGERSSFPVHVRNTGNAPGIIGAIGASGEGFSVTDLPFLPQTLAPNDFLTFTLAYAPTEPGRANGRLRIGPDTFELSGVGIGVRFLFSHRLGSTVNSVSPGGAVIFSPLAVGQTTRSEFSIRNTGTTSTTISSIGVGDTRGAFKIEELPPFPITLAPDESMAFPIVFSPLTTGVVTAPLLIDSTTFTLTGIGNPPESLPAYHFTGASGTQPALGQPAVGLSLADPYPLLLRGTLTMTVNSEAFLADPAIQFATGGRTVSFTIPANATQAIFQNGLPEIRLQTGTVASSIQLTPVFTTQSGLDVTPEPADPLLITVPRTAPRLISAQITSLTPTSFTLAITGFSTTRAVSRLEFQFTPASGAVLPASRFDMNVEADSAAWYGSQSSLPFGGNFVVSVPFNLRVSSGTAAVPSENIGSVAITAVNGEGPSNTLTVGIR